MVDPWILISMPIAAAQFIATSTGAPVRIEASALGAVGAPAPRVMVPNAQRDLRNNVINPLPDLKVKDIQIEGDHAIHILVANEGAGDAPMSIALRVEGSPDSFAAPSGHLITSGLTAGETRWLSVVDFRRRTGGDLLSGERQSERTPLSAIERFVVVIDPAVILSTGLNFKSNPAYSISGACPAGRKDGAAKGLHLRVGRRQQCARARQR